MIRLCCRCKKVPKYKKSSYCKECNRIISSEKYHGDEEYRKKEIDRAKKSFKKKYNTDEKFREKMKIKNKKYRKTENFAVSQIKTYIKRLDKKSLEKAKDIIKDYMVKK